MFESKCAVRMHKSQLCPENFKSSTHWKSRLISRELLDLAAQVPSIVLARHAPTMLKYATRTKVRNCKDALSAYWLERTNIASKPAFLSVEKRRQCGVGDIYCSAPEDERFYSKRAFLELMDTIRDYLFMVHIYEVGETLLHASIVECIRYAHQSNIATVVSSSLSASRPVAFWRELCTSGLDRLIVTIDGLSESSYRVYRTGYDFALVMDNLEQILSCRSECRSKLKVEWQMVDLPWNRPEQAAARRYAKRIGCDAFRLVTEDCLHRTKNSEPAAERKRSCVWSYLFLLVDAYGVVLPCFKPDCHPSPVGNLNTESFESIWNGDDMQDLRSRKRIVQRPACRTCRE